MNFDSSEFCDVGEVRGKKKGNGKVVISKCIPSRNVEVIYRHLLEIPSQTALSLPPDENRRCES